MAVGDIFKVRVVLYNGTLTEAHLGINVTYWRIASQTGLGVTAAEIATALDGTWETPYKDVVSANANYRGVGAQLVQPLLGTESVAVGNAAAGGVAGDLLSAQSGLIVKKTALGGRSHQGRTYVPFPSEGDNTAANEQSAGYQANLVLLAVAIDIQQVIVGAGGTATLDQVVYHRDTGTGTALVSYIPSVPWATQRRRMPRGRRQPVPF